MPLQIVVRSSLLPPWVQLIVWLVLTAGSLYLFKSTVSPDA